MGKNLKNKELGKGISQRKDGRYSARYRTRDGGRVEKYFDSVREARDWFEKAKYENTNCTVYPPFEMVAEDIVKNDAALPAYVHITEDEKHREIDLVADALKVV
ncbi:MAG: hypothetical protein IJ930_02780 [Lachnospiraceae bacterium]|nr:hypothetical protein [Lachnospiraceae bacterium]